MEANVLTVLVSIIMKVVSSVHSVLVSIIMKEVSSVLTVLVLIVMKVVSSVPTVLVSIKAMGDIIIVSVLIVIVLAMMTRIMASSIHHTVLVTIMKEVSSALSVLVRMAVDVLVSHKAAPCCVRVVI